MSVKVERVKNCELFFADAERDHRPDLGVQAGRAQRLVERRVAVARHRAEDHVGRACFDRGYRLIDVVAAEKDVLLAHQFTAEKL